MAATVKIRVLRPCMYKSRRQEANTVVSVSYDDAVLMIEGGRCELVNPADAAILRTAVTAATRESLASENAKPRSTRRPAPTEGPWSAMH